MGPDGEQSWFLMTALAKLQNGRFFQDAAAISGVEEEAARKALAALVPAIALRLKLKAEQDAEAYDDLLDLLEDGADLDDPAGAEAIADGNAILSEIYGSRNTAITEARKLAVDLAEMALAKLAAIAATAVLASLARRHAPAMGLVGAPRAASRDGSLLGTIIAAIVKGAVQGAVRQLAPKRRRRRRSYGSYFGRKRRRTPVTRRRKRSRALSLDDIFADILGTRNR